MFSSGEGGGEVFGYHVKWEVGLSFSHVLAPDSYMVGFCLEGCVVLKGGDFF